MQQNIKLTEQQRRAINDIYQITKKRRQITAEIDKSMHEEFDQILQEAEYKCVACKKTFKGRQIGAHYRNNKRCSYMKERPWIKSIEALPKNWRKDLEAFNRENEEKRI